MPETTPLIKAALNLRVGVGFDVYVLSTCHSTYYAVHAWLMWYKSIEFIEMI